MMQGKQELEKYFDKFRRNIIGIDQEFETPFGIKKIIYADWIASGRLYSSIEEKLCNEMSPFVGNTHTETSITGTLMTRAYHEARTLIKTHVNAAKDDVLIFAGFGMTAAVNKFQRILGLKAPEQLAARIDIKQRPVVFITHMEHHSNHTSWLETIADVLVIKPDERGLPDLGHLEHLLELYRDRPMKIGSFTAASNVTGVETEYHKMAAIMHRHGGYCFVDFAASAPYVDINMHPENPEEALDAIFFSPHKFLGGPGTSGIMVFNSKLYKKKIPDHPGGGTVSWTNPWGGHKFIDDIEAREDGGTPGFLQAIKAALAVKLKEDMGTSNLRKREEELVKKVFEVLPGIKGIHLLAPELPERLGAISFYAEDIHYNLLVKLLNDMYGIQVRGGCSCAGTYGHYLLHVDPTRSRRITDKINAGDLSEKPGWVRLSLHPTMTDEELDIITGAIKDITQNVSELVKDYEYLSSKNEYVHKNEPDLEKKYIGNWFTL